jgi:hypothetical protein
MIRHILLALAVIATLAVAGFTAHSAMACDDNASYPAHTT